MRFPRIGELARWDSTFRVANFPILSSDFPSPLFVTSSRGWHLESVGLDDFYIAALTRSVKCRYVPAVIAGLCSCFWFIAHDSMSSATRDLPLSLTAGGYHSSALLPHGPEPVWPLNRRASFRKSQQGVATVWLNRVQRRAWLRRPSNVCCHHRILSCCVRMCQSTVNNEVTYSQYSAITHLTSYHSESACLGRMIQQLPCGSSRSIL